MIAVNQELGRASNGQTSDVLAPSAYNVWRACLAIDTPWEQTEQEAWDRVATMAIRIVDENIHNDASMSAKDFARDLFVLAYGPEAIQKWPELPYREQMTWETVGRHFINCLDADAATVDPSAIEPLALRWFTRKLLGDQS